MGAEMNKELSIDADKNEINLKENGSDYTAAALKALIGIGNVPVVGPILNEIIGSVIPNQKSNRIILFAEVFATKVKHIENDVLEVKLKTEKNTDLLEDILPQAARALTNERREYIATFLMNSLATEESEHIGEKKLLSLLNQLNDIEIIILKSEAITFRKRQEFYALHKNVFSNNLNNSRANQGKVVLRRSYDIKLEDLGLISRKYESHKRKPVPEFDTKTGKLKSQDKQISALGLMSLKYIDDSFSEDR